MLQEALKKEGIPSFIKSDDIAITFPSYGTTSAVEVTIWVPEEDVERAEEIADQMLDHIWELRVESLELKAKSRELGAKSIEYRV